MSNKYAYILLFATSVLVSAGCGPSARGDDGGPGDDDDDGVTDASVADTSATFIDAFVPPIFDAGNVYPDASNGTGDGDGGTCAGTTCPNPVQAGCGATEICDNGSDDNCNGNVDEGCACQPGSVQSCFANPPGYRGIGACQDGMQTCQGSGEFTQWGPCQGGITPHAEACDSLDNDCNGCVDDDPMCCEVELNCPASMPEGAPFENYVIDGTMFFGGPVANWTWTVTGGPCDQLLAPSVSYTLNGTATTTVSGATASTLTFRPTLSGDYTVRVVMTLADGTIYECTFIVHIGGPGLRVELCWDTTGADDVDLHVHKPGDTTPWFTTNGTSSGTTNTADCFYSNCKASSFGTAPNWGYANSPLAECVGGPEGASWQLLGYCRNPRLDLDNIFTVGKPENVNIDRPANASTYRVAVHHYSGTGPSHPLVNVYCGGTLQATYGQAPDLVPGFTAGGGYARGPIWRVVDVTTQVDAAGVTTGCTLAPLAGAGTTHNVSCGGNATCTDNAF